LEHHHQGRRFSGLRLRFSQQLDALLFDQSPVIDIISVGSIGLPEAVIAIRNP
jgi:hypothetical protein